MHQKKVHQRDRLHGQVAVGMIHALSTEILYISILYLLNANEIESPAKPAKLSSPPFAVCCSTAHKQAKLYVIREERRGEDLRE